MYNSYNYIINNIINLINDNDISKYEDDIKIFLENKYLSLIFFKNELEYVNHIKWDNIKNYIMNYINNNSNNNSIKNIFINTLLKNVLYSLIIKYDDKIKLITFYNIELNKYVDKNKDIENQKIINDFKNLNTNYIYNIY